MQTARKRKTSHFVCQQCGVVSAKWLGRCASCGVWGSLSEEAIGDHPLPALGDTEHATPMRLAQVTSQAQSRLLTHIGELDRVLGGGLVPGSLVLIGGEPGIGKSTLLLQTMDALARLRVLYISGEESVNQIKMRAERLQLAHMDQVFVLAQSDIEIGLTAAAAVDAQVVVVDSIQTMHSQRLEAAVGTVAQIRHVTDCLLRFAKAKHIPVLIVGHVTKEGLLAGPKVMEHMVDTVLYFEGDRLSHYRLLRAHKNRFGSSSEVGVFSMEAEGLVGIDNPSGLFLAQRGDAPGAVVVTSMEGSRPLLLEVQALVVASHFGGTPRRTTTGFDGQRVSMLAAILAARAHLDLSKHDIFVNVAGGVKLTEPAADLGVLLALASAARNQALSPHLVAVGEVGLAGEIRSANHIVARLQACAALGFEQVLLPTMSAGLSASMPAGLQGKQIHHVRQALQYCGLAAKG